MRIGTRSGLASGNVRPAWVTVVLVAMLFPPGDVAFSQTSTATVAHTPLFNAIDLNPSGFDESHATGISGGEQVGYGSGPATEGHTHALLWRGSAASIQDLHPSGVVLERVMGGTLDTSIVAGICSGQQVGYGRNIKYSETRALMWHGSASGVVDFHPSGPVSLVGIGDANITDSEIWSTAGGQQVGYGQENATSGYTLHALLWRGNSADVVELQSPSGVGESFALGASSEELVGFGYISSTGPTHALLWHAPSASTVVDLHPSGFISSRAESTSGGQQVGYGAGPATGGQDHALMWHGTSASVVDLHPKGFFYSRVLGTNGEEQVGWGDQHALLWRGSAASVVDLHTFLPPGFTISVATDIDATGDVVGTAWGPASSSRYHAFLWKRNVPKSAAPGKQSDTRCVSP